MKILLVKDILLNDVSVVLATIIKLKSLSKIKFYNGFFSKIFKDFESFNS